MWSFMWSYVWSDWALGAPAGGVEHKQEEKCILKVLCECVGAFHELIFRAGRITMHQEKFETMLPHCCHASRERRLRRTVWIEYSTPVLIPNTGIGTLWLQAGKYTPGEHNATLVGCAWRSTQTAGGRGGSTFSQEEERSCSGVGQVKSFNASASNSVRVCVCISTHVK